MDPKTSWRQDDVTLLIGSPPPIRWIFLMGLVTQIKPFLEGAGTLPKVPSGANQGSSLPCVLTSFPQAQNNHNLDLYSKSQAQLVCSYLSPSAKTLPTPTHHVRKHNLVFTPVGRQGIPSLSLACNQLSNYHPTTNHGAIPPSSHVLKGKQGKREREKGGEGGRRMEEI